MEVDSSAWDTLPKLAEPAPGDPVTNNPGHVFNLNVQGMEFGGADHYVVEDLTDGSGAIRVTVWYDDPIGSPEGMKWARVSTFLPLVPDPNLAGAINTRQSFVIYAQPDKMALLPQPVENTEFRPWTDFQPPPEEITRHGKWVTDTLVKTHDTLTFPAPSWREWGDHLDPSELDFNVEVKARDHDGRTATRIAESLVKSQRRLGRFAPSRGTITYFLHDVVLASGVHVAEEEEEMEETDVAIPVNVRCDLNASSAELCYVFTTPSGSPNDANWPNGLYRCSIDVAAQMGGVTYGFLTVNGAAGHMANVDSGLTTDNESWTQTQGAFSGTGIKVGSRTIDPAAGAAGDRFECLLAVDNPDTMGGRMDLSHDDSDSFGEGPWTDGATPVSNTVVAKHEALQGIRQTV